MTPIGGFTSTMCFTKYTREDALLLRSQPRPPLNRVGLYPDEYHVWLNLHDRDDVEHLAEWTFSPYISGETRCGQ